MESITYYARRKKRKGLNLSFLLLFSPRFQNHVPMYSHGAMKKSELHSLM